MQIIEATPPTDFPAQVVVMDKEVGRRHPSKAFYLRVAVEDGTDHIDLEGAITPLEARKIAREKGYEPTHWMEVGSIRPTVF
ncbi:hypothetical protein [Cupriavidus sp. WS]|uniref:hypothetical protein n=1 Tax=Cupriavidus sp. WS TaxID=1312922 RepID=UPI00037EAB89|nr:hypothetical protein [Cupriavidus sp. WS]